LIIKAITASRHYRFPPTDEQIETLFLRDESQDQYMLYQTGWVGSKPISNVVILARIKEGKIWIEEDWTEEGIVTELLRLGVPPADIVQAWVHPDLRETPEPLLAPSTA
jgi:hypothetical protein